ncbi:MAG: heat-inducible transcription repressor HrcA, partial [Proteobacteria bacterium]|nr:heat-inducible transcription repressor HrcA [Pseudomonadota bacterium]
MDIQELNNRSRDIFRIIVETYLDSGEPIGSRTVSRISGIDLSPASVRNVMADLEEFGLLSSPHTSAGRLPTEAGLRLFVDGLLEIGDLTSEQRAEIESRCAATGRGVEEVLAEATQMLSGLSHCASLVMAPKQNAPLKQIEFVHLQPGRGLVVLVFENGSVENRIISLPPGLPPSALVQAANYLNARLAGRTFEEISRLVHDEMTLRQAELDSLTAEVVESGLATWAGGERAESTLIVRGRANLLEEDAATGNLERIRQL